MHHTMGLHRALMRPLASRKPTLPLAPMFVRSSLRCANQRSLMNASAVTAKMKASMEADPVKWWLFTCAGLVTATVTVGAASHLTHAGDSVLHWTPQGEFPPLFEKGWRREFEAYSDFSKRHDRTPISFEEFPDNFKYVFMHRRLDQASTLAFIGPLGYFYLKKRLPASIRALLGGVLALGVTQMYIERHAARTIVSEHQKRGPGEEIDHHAQHGLPLDVGVSMAKLSLLLWAGLHVVYPPLRAVTVREMTMTHALKDIEKLRQYVKYSMWLFAGTAVAGTVVAGIDAGKEFNTFPKMGDKWVPDGLFEQKPWLRNFYENVALVQLDHRILAVSTLGAYSFVYLKARKLHIWENLPPESKKAFNWMMLAVGGQVVGGVTMLVNAVPTTLAMVHTTGAAAILGTSLWTLYTLRFARPINAVSVVNAVASKVL